LKETKITLKSEDEQIDEMFGINRASSGVDACSSSQIEIRNNISTIVANGEQICDDGYDMGF
jgi:hypothetical protein